MTLSLETLHKRVADIDVHRMKHVITALIEDDAGNLSKETREFGGFKRDLKALAGWLHGLRVELVILESTGIYWKSVYAHLENAGLLAWVVNAHHVKNVPGHKTDVGDSEWLAQLGRYGLVHGSFIPPRDLRELRQVSRYRMKAANMLAAEKNRLHKVLDDAGIKLGGLVLIEIGDDLSHFGSADRLASWGALCPGNNESAGKRKSGKTRKGNTMLRYLLCEAANSARRTMTVFRSKYLGLVVRRGHKKAIVALAQKMIRTIYFMLTRHQAYRDSGFDYAAANVKKNAPRWLRALKQFGYWPETANT